MEIIKMVRINIMSKYSSFFPILFLSSYKLIIRTKPAKPDTAEINEYTKPVIPEFAIVINARISIIAKKTPHEVVITFIKPPMIPEIIVPITPLTSAPDFLSTQYTM